MPDPIPHDDLTSYPHRRDAYRLSALLEHILEEEPGVSVLAALVKTFLHGCYAADIDPEAAFAQILDAELSGQIEVHPNDWDELRPTLLNNH